MGTTRRAFVLGGAALAATAGASSAHQAWLWVAEPRPGKAPLAAIPVFDLRGSDPATHAISRKGEVLGLAQSCVGPLTPVARLGLDGADILAGRWLRASGSPYVGELERIAEGTGVSGVHLLNASYEWGCTSLAAPSPDGGSARLLRTLDWPFHGLGRRVEAWIQSGPAGEFVNLSWPGSVGLLTGMAPGRFAAAINQPPVKRRAIGDSPLLDAVAGSYAAWESSGRIPALHLLRRVFETTVDYASARRMLETTPIAAPAIFTLVGVNPDQTCVVERDVADFHTHEGVSSAANVWRYGTFPGTWRGGRASEEAHDSTQRSDMIESWAGKATTTGDSTSNFEWVKAPILNAMTRLAVEADPGKGVLRAVGFEEAPGDADTAEWATLPLEWAAGT